MHIRQHRSSTAPILKKIAANHPVTMRSHTLSMHPFAPACGGYVLYDVYDTHNPRNIIASQKEASSQLNLEHHKLTATLLYSHAAKWTLSIRDSKGSILYQRRKAYPAVTPLTHSPHIGLFDIVLHQCHGAPSGWAVITDGALRICVPYAHKNTLSIWSASFTCISQKPRQPIISYHSHHHQFIDLWKTEKLSCSQTTPTLTYPSVARIHMHKNKKPFSSDIPPPNKHDLWPQDAQNHFSPLQKYIAALVFHLPDLKIYAANAILQEQKKSQKASLAQLRYFGFKGALKHQDLMNFTLPSRYQPKSTTPSTKASKCAGKGASQVKKPLRHGKKTQKACNPKKRALA